MQTLQVQRVRTINDQALRVRTAPLTDSQLGFISFISHSSHQDRILLGTKFMGEHLGEVVGYLYRLEMIIDKTISRLSPFQDDIGALFTVKCKETVVQCLTFRFEHTDCYLNASLTQLSDAPALNLGKRIHTANNGTPHTFLNDQIGTRGGLTIMRTGLQTHIDGCFFQKWLVFCTHRGKRIYLGMSFATTHMIALTDNPAIRTHDHSTHHRIGLGILLTIPSQLQTAPHVFFVVYHHFFTVLLFYLFTFYYLCIRYDIRNALPQTIHML